MSEKEKKNCCNGECDCEHEHNHEECTHDCDCGCCDGEDIVELTTEDGKKLKFFFCLNVFLLS